MMDEKKRTEVEEQTKEWLKKWDGKCLICEKPVVKSDLMPNGMPDMINGAVVETPKYIEVYGHSTCVQNVNKFVVIPNRVRVR